MNRRRGFRYLLAAGALAAASCSVPRTHYYVLDVPPTPQAGVPAVARQIAVQTFRADQVFSDERIAYRENGNEVNHYDYHRWADPPEDMVTNFFIRRLNDSGAYAGVSPYK